jgi:hypothetical protein
VTSIPAGRVALEGAAGGRAAGGDAEPAAAEGERVELEDRMIVLQPHTVSLQKTRGVVGTYGAAIATASLIAAGRILRMSRAFNNAAFCMLNLGDS